MALGDTERMQTTNDTSPAAHAVYLSRLAQMTPAERTNIAAALWEAGHRLQRASVRQQYPNLDEADIVFQIAVTRFGAELACKVYQKK